MFLFIKTILFNLLSHLKRLFLDIRAFVLGLLETGHDFLPEGGELVVEGVFAFVDFFFKRFLLDTPGELFLESGLL